jgi:hypothetical protein
MSVTRSRNREYLSVDAMKTKDSLFIGARGILSPDVGGGNGECATRRDAVEALTHI